MAKADFDNNLGFDAHTRANKKARACDPDLFRIFSGKLTHWRASPPAIWLENLVEITPCSDLGEGSEQRQNPLQP